MAKEYPRIASINQLPKVNFCPCGRVATWAVEVQVNWMRGEDETVFRCDQHKRDIVVQKAVTEGSIRG